MCQCGNGAKREETAQFGDAVSEENALIRRNRPKTSNWIPKMIDRTSNVSDGHARTITPSATVRMPNSTGMARSNRRVTNWSIR